MNNTFGDEGYILEVDLIYPSHLHTRHNDFPLAPEKLNVKKLQLSQFCDNLKQRLQLGDSSIEKLIPSFLPKTNYVVHFKNLKLYLQLGLELAKVHRGVKFEQKEWLKNMSTLIHKCDSKLKMILKKIILN